MTKKKPAKKKPPAKPAVPEAEQPLPVERIPPARPVEKVAEPPVIEVVVPPVPDPPVVVVVEPEYRRRSSVTGKFVTAWFAILHPRTTMRERRERSDQDRHP